jgi:hypothetical protein
MTISYAAAAGVPKAACAPAEFVVMYQVSCSAHIDTFAVVTSVLHSASVLHVNA